MHGVNDGRCRRFLDRSQPQHLCRSNSKRLVLTHGRSVKRSTCIGTAGWNIPGPCRAEFATDGTQLERYAVRFPCTEINSSFHRPHRPATYARWAASVPKSFAFALKLPQEITHKRRLTNSEHELTQFLEDTSALGAKRRVLLVQLSPSFVFDDQCAGRFFELLRRGYDGYVVCEPRHPSWFAPLANSTLRAHRIGRVAADPALTPAAAAPGGWPGIVYYRRHGSPRMYHSSYSLLRIRALAQALESSVAPERWCVFDNTTAGAATRNALELLQLVSVQA